jgi:hypothetical protein
VKGKNEDDVERKAVTLNISREENQETPTRYEEK